VKRFAARHRKNIQVIPDAVLDTLKCQPWPGNVRELQNVVERAVIATQGNTLVRPHGLEMQESDRTSPSRTLAEVERRHILETLRDTNWVVGGWNGAAVRLGLSRTTLIARMQRLGISREAASRIGARQMSQRRVVAGGPHQSAAE
jgi:transcriptional regulator with GAF, ATPase, and Fis domain